MKPTGDAGIVDMHAHYYGEALLQALEGRHGRLPRVDRDSDGTRYLVTPTARLPIGRKYLSLDARLEWMAETGIVTQMVTFPGALGPDALPLDEAVWIVPLANDELAEVSRSHPGVFPALGGLPLADMKASAAELERIMSKGLIGAILPGNYFLDMSQMAKLEPVLDAANRLGAHLMIHPGPRADESIVRAAWGDLAQIRASTVALSEAITHAMVTLMHADLGERFPNLTIQVVNLGGTLPFILERMDHVASTRSATNGVPSDRLGAIYVDCASQGPRALGLAVEVFGADRVMLGTDYPIFTTTVAQDAVRGLPSAADRAMVGSGTARTILDRFR